MVSFGRADDLKFEIANSEFDSGPGNRRAAYVEFIQDSQLNHPCARNANQIRERRGSTDAEGNGVWQRASSRIPN